MMRRQQYFHDHQPPSRKPWTDLSADEVIERVQSLYVRLIAKKRRERIYLNRRARKGIQTPTDEAYEADQELEDELLELLEAMAEAARQQQADANECP